MDWYYYILIGVGALFGLFLIVLIFGKLTKPSYKKVQKYLVQKPVEEVKSVEISTKKMDTPIGLNLEGKFNIDDFDVEETQERKDDFGGLDFSKLKKPVDKKKPLLEQIRELSPELKALVFDRGLARKDYEFMSKKDWIRIPFNEV